MSKSKPDPRLPPSADTSPPEVRSVYVEGDPVLPDDFGRIEYDAATDRPQWLVLPEVATAFPDHEVLRTDSSLLPCRLTDSEKLAKGDRLAALVAAAAALEDEAKEIRAQLKERADSLASEQTGVARDLRRGAEDRVIATVVLADYRTNEAKTVRQDTLEVLWSRALTPEERQRVLFPSGEQRSTVEPST